MPGFEYNQSSLTCDGVSLAALARAHDTPLYVYSGSIIRERFHALTTAFAAHPHRIHYALKANSTLSLLRMLRAAGAGADANSGGEIDVALRAGFIPPDIVFTGVGKTVDELGRAVALGVKAINAESPGELGRIDEQARALGVRAPVALRINPDIDAESHPHISTGLKRNKFGVAIEDARALYRWASTCAGLQLVGLHVHIGSQMTSTAPLQRAVASAVALAREIQSDGVTLDHLDIGGGIGISYDQAPVPAFAEYAAAVLPAVRDLGLPLVLEPGRAIVGPAGVLVAQVIDEKTHPSGRRFLVLDAGMSEIMRPALYGAFHRIDPVDRRNEEASASFDIVGPLCESTDVLGTDRIWSSSPRIGEFAAVRDAGAYGVVMANNYNRRPLPAEVLVDEGSARLVRRRQTVEDMLALED